MSMFNPFQSPSMDHESHESDVVSPGRELSFFSKLFDVHTTRYSRQRVSINTLTSAPSSHQANLGQPNSRRKPVLQSPSIPPISIQTQYSTTCRSKIPDGATVRWPAIRCAIWGGHPSFGWGRRLGLRKSLETWGCQLLSGLHRGH